MRDLRVADKIFSKYKTIQSAISQALPGDRIVIAEGYYVETIRLNKNIQLVAETPGEVRIAGFGESHQISGDVIVRGINFIELPTRFNSILIERGSPLFENCVFRDISIHIVNSDTTPRFKSCEMFATKKNDDNPGVIFDQASGTIVDCHIHDYGGTNMVVRGGANPTIKKSHIYGSERNGVYITGDCQPTFDSCRIYKNNWPNLFIEDHANPQVIHTHIYEGFSTGVTISSNGLGEFKGCEFYKNTDANVELTLNGQSVFRKCKVYEGNANGLVARDNAQGYFSECEFFGSEYPNISIREGANPTIQDSKIYHSTNGIKISSNGKGRIERCEIYNSSLPNIVIESQGNPVLIDCKIFESQSNNVYVLDEGLGYFEKCEIYKSTEANILINSNGNPLFDQCEIYEGKGNGIYTDGALGQIRNSRILNNEFPGIAISNGSKMEISNCKIHGHNVGVYINNDGHGDIQKCEIYNNEEENVMVTHAEGLLQDTKLYGSTDSLWVNDQGKVTVTNTLFYDNEENGLLLSKDGFAKLIQCKIYENGKQGIYMYEQGKAELIQSDVYMNNDTNLYLKSKSEAILDDCNVYKSDVYGIELKEEAKVTLSNTKVYQNKMDNYLISECSTIQKLEKMNRVQGEENIIPTNAFQDFRPKSEVYEEAIQKMNSMIGLTEIKTEIKNFIMELQGRKKMELRGISSENKPSMHMMFTGAPGTGKTEVARIMAKLLYGMGLIDSNNFVEADRSTIVGKYIGHTEDNMKKLIESALGGVLFIDEAYALASGGESDFGKEAIDVLMKAMEDHRGNLVVILAGYQVEMDDLLRMNEGFKSRIPYTFEFPDYTPKELTSLTFLMLKQLKLNPEKVENEIESIVLKEGKSGKIHGNARWVRTFVEQIVRHYHIRIGSNEEEMVTEELTIQDIHKAAGISERVKDPNKQNGLQTIKDEALAELNKMIGLSNVKSEIQRIMNYIIIEQKRKQKGLTNQNPNLHMIFYGPPGTGKTTVARVLGKFLKGIGILTRGDFNEADRSKIVGKYIGHTEENMTKLIERSLGGILFIDEAYALAKGGENDFGKEAIDVLIKSLEDHRDNLIVIMAGYEEEMKHLLDMNPGFTSRMPFRIHFNHYSPEEIISIAKSLLEEKMFWMSKESEQCLVDEINKYAIQHNNLFDGNARWARNLVEKIHMEQNNRLASSDDDSDLQEVVTTDIQSVLARID